MSDYQSKSLNDILRRINADERPIYLPSIQRHFVWKPDRICKLFDSIMQGFPIGTFLFWDVPDDERNQYAFYKFIDQFSEFDRDYNDPAPRHPAPDVTGVLDGQQRLNSLYVALKGSYEEYKGGTGRPRNSKNSYSTRRLYLDLLGEPDEDDHWKYSFDFLSDDELAWRMANKQEAWIAVGEALYLSSVEQCGERWDSLKSEVKDVNLLTAEDDARALHTLDVLRKAIQKEDLITYYTVRDRNLTEALEIFIRVNSGGITLNQTDLYFSTIAAYWRDGRSEVETFLQEINGIGQGFDFEISALILGCLALTEGPIQLKVESFGPEQVEYIRDHWSEICSHMRESAVYLDAWGFSGNNSISIHAGLPVAIAHRAGYDMRSSAEDLRKLVIRSLVSDFYARGTSRRNKVLTEIRKFMASDAQANPSFSLDRLMASINLPAGLSFHISDEMIEELLETQIGKPKAFLLLSLLHGQHALHQTYFDKDHIHPWNGFGDLAGMNIPQEDHHQWYHRRDQLPNLQLLQGGDNRSKQDKPFKEWLEKFRPDQQQRTRYLDENDIPVDASLDFADFLTLFEKRKDLLRKKLVSILGSKVSSQVNTESEMATTVP
jgi:hypothetical protein